MCFFASKCSQPYWSGAVGSDGEWFRLHDAGGPGVMEGALSLSAACCDVDHRRTLYGLPIAVPPERRVTRGQSQSEEAQ